MRAQKDICGVGKTKEWELAVQSLFEVEHWQYTHAKQETAECFEKTLGDSLFNLSKDAAIVLKTASVMAAIVVLGFV
jgi:hypothetical protein